MLLQILQHTPIWVFGLFIGLVFLGYTQTKTRLLSVQRLIIFPIVMLSLSALGIASSFGVHFLSFTLWLCGIAVAFTINHWIASPRGAHYISAEQVFSLPGSWLPMVLIMVIFFTKYLVGVLLALHPETIHQHSFVVSACLLFGLSSGFFFARAFCVYQTAKTPNQTR
jgi:hypothetical protein